MIKFLNECIKCRGQLRTLFSFGLKAKILGTRLGVIWWIIDPLILMGVYYFLIGVVMKRGGDNYHFFVLSGVIVWQTFSRSLSQMTTAFRSNRQLIMSFSSPLSLYVITPALVNCFFFVLSMGIVVAFNLDAFSLVSLQLIPLLLVFFCFMIAIGFIFSCLNVYVRDTHLVVTYTLRVAFYASPVLYDVSMVANATSIPQWMKTAYSLNPMVFFITSFRDILIYGKGIALQEFAIVSVAVVCALQLSWLVFQYMRNSLPKMI